MPKIYPHIFLPTPPEKSPFKNVSQRINTKKPPDKIDRQAHSDFLKRKLRKAWEETESDLIAHHITRNGIYLEFKGNPGYELATKSLEDLRSKKVRLMNVRQVQVGPENQKVTMATVFVANDKKELFFDKFIQYATEKTSKGNPKHAELVNSIANIRKADKIRSFWMDDESLIPEEEQRWCEVWLNNDTEQVIARFEELLNHYGIRSKTGLIRFPERTVKVILANASQLARLTLNSDDIAEYRRAKETASFWLEMNNFDQAAWTEDIRKRTRYTPEPEVAICILDTGINNGHPLLAPLLADKDCFTAEPDWGTHDHDKHGTLMAGVAAYGDLIACLKSSNVIEINHRLESAKILPLPPEQTEPNLWGDITARGIFSAEIQEPFKKRIICMAVSAEDTRDRGRPSSWSGSLDQLASGSEDDHQRLLIVCAGNITNLEAAKVYPHCQVTDSVHDPGQSWNALTIGAYTCLDQIDDRTMEGYEPIAPKQGLSPFSTTSAIWDDAWPIKPELVMEGGNLAQNEDGFVSECDSLSLLSTYYKPLQAHFYPFLMTSASTASAAWLAARIWAQYPIKSSAVYFTRGNQQGLPIRGECRGNPLWLPRRNRKARKFPSHKLSHWHFSWKSV